MKWNHAKTSVITGAGSGIGRAMAIEGARRGLNVGVVDFNKDAAEGTLEKVEEIGGKGEVYCCDVRNLEEVQSMADYFFSAWGEVGLLVNNAGVAAGGHVGDIPMEDWERVIETDLWGVIYGCHSFIPRMKAQGGGYLANTASMCGLVPPAQEAPYNVAKAGVIGLSETLKTELAPFNIGVSVLCPMSVDTNMFNNFSDSGDFLTELFRISFSHAKMTSEEVAQVLFDAVEKNKLYVVPHLSGKLFWLNKRLMPSAFFKSMAYLNKKGLAVPFLTQLAKRGWM